MTPLEQIGNDKLVETIARNMRVESEYYNESKKVYMNSFVTLSSAIKQGYLR